MNKENTQNPRILDGMVRCACGWVGGSSERYHRVDSNDDGMWCDQLECPKCYTVIDLNEPNASADLPATSRNRFDAFVRFYKLQRGGGGERRERQA